MNNSGYTGPRVAVVGCGGWGKNLVRNFAELGALEAVCDPVDSTVQKFASDFNCRAMTFEEVLVDDRIDGVVIAAPAELHYSLAARCLESGKHTYVEKPLALQIEDAKRLCEQASNKARTLMVGHLLQYHPVFLEMLEMVRKGDLGRLRYVYSNRLNLGKIRREEDVMWSFAPHDISMVLALMGAEPDTVEATGSYFLHEKIADTVTVQLGFEDGRSAQIFSSWLHPVKEQKLVVVGEDGMAIFDDTKAWDEKLQLFRHKIEWRDQIPVPIKAEGEYVKVAQDEPLKLECQHFLNCIEKGEQPRTDGPEGLRVLTVLSKAAKSMIARKAEDRSSISTEERFEGVTIHESAYVDDGVAIGRGTKIWHFSHVLGNVTIGENCNIGQNVVIGPNVTVGNRVKIQNNVSVYQGVTLEDGVFCGPSCVFTNVNNPRSEIERKTEYLQTPVGRGATIGANATIVCGHRLGAYSFIAAGAVVATDVPDYALMAGVPAKRIGWMSKAGGRLKDDLVCPIDGTKYEEIEPNRIAPAA